MNKAFLLLVLLVSSSQVSSAAFVGPTSFSSHRFSPTAKFITPTAVARQQVQLQLGKDNNEEHTQKAAVNVIPPQLVSFAAACALFTATTATVDVPPAFAAVSPTKETTTTITTPSEKTALLSAKAALERESAQLSAAQKELKAAEAANKAAEAKAEAASSKAKKAKIDYIKLNDALAKAKGPSAEALQKKVGT